MCNFIVCLVSVCLRWPAAAMWNDQNHSSLPLLTVMTNWLNSKHAHGWYHGRNVILKAKSENPENLNSNPITSMKDMRLCTIRPNNN